MSKKIILIILIFVLMMNLLIGVIYASEETKVNVLREISIENIEGEQSEANVDDSTVESLKSKTNFITSSKKQTSEINKRIYFLIGSIVVLIIVLAFVERLKAFKIILKLFLTVLIIYFIFINMIVKDYSIALFSILTILLIAISNILIKSGIHRKAFAELISVLIITALATIAVFVTVKIYDMQLLNDNLQRFKTFANTQYNILAVISFVFLGIFMDVVSTLVMRLDVSKDKTIDISLKEQFKNGINIGKELIIEKFNMIFLILFGMSSLTICVFMKDGFTVMELITTDQIFLLLAFIIIGSIGTALTVPITAIIYGTLNNKKTIYKTVPENRIDGKRSLKL